METLETLTTRLDNLTWQSIGHLLAGGTSGAIALALIYPIEQLNTRRTVGVHSSARVITARIIADDFFHFRIENLQDIYRGVYFGICEKFMFNGIYFFFYNLLKDDWKKHNSGEMPLLIALFRGSIAGICTQIFTLPLGTIQKILQTTDSTDPNNCNASIIITNILETHGIGALWSGMGMSCVLTINPAINIYTYERIRGYLSVLLGRKSAIIDFVSGLLSKAIATVICYPLIYIKVCGQAANQGENKKKSTFEFIVETYREYGIKQFYSALTSKLFQSSLNNALMFMIKEKVSVYMFAMMVYLVEIKRKQIKNTRLQTQLT